MRRNSPGEDEKSHSLQVGFTKRFSNRWQASATYSLTLEYEKNYPVLLPEMAAFPQTAGGCTVPGHLERDVHGVELQYAGDLHRGSSTTAVTGTGQTTRCTAPSSTPSTSCRTKCMLSGLYFYGDNGYATTRSGVDIHGVGGQIAARTRADGSIIPVGNFNKKDLHRVDLRAMKRFSFNDRFSMEPMIEVFNLFNRANFTTWVLNERNARFGQPTRPTVSRISRAPCRSGSGRASRKETPKSPTPNSQARGRASWELGLGSWGFGSSV